MGLAGHVVLNALFSLFLLSIAAVNYPGGKAIARLQRIEPPDAQVNVHICNLAAQTGVSRFTQIYNNWRLVKYSAHFRHKPLLYGFPSISKNEILLPTLSFEIQFTHTLGIVLSLGLWIQGLQLSATH